MLTKSSAQQVRRQHKLVPQSTSLVIKKVCVDVDALKAV